jgi:hypothetical protein
MDHDILHALNATEHAAPTVEARVERLESLIDLVLQSKAVTPVDPDATPGEVVIPEDQRRSAMGDGGTVAAFAYPLPNPFGYLRVRIDSSGEVPCMVVIWRSPAGDMHRAEFPF